MKTQLTKDIEKALYLQSGADHIGKYGCFEVSLGRYGDEYVDFVTMDSKDDFYCYEIKISKSDFLSKNKISFCGNYNYLVIPQSIYRSIVDLDEFKLLVAEGIGLLVYDLDIKAIVIDRKSRKKALSLSKRIELMHCLVRSMSRYVTKSIFHKTQ